jgi:pantoate--beta-alanine ligase
VREADGLALSSRNAYLSPAERQAATALPRVMAAIRDRLLAGGDPAAVLAEGRAELAAAGFDPIDYLALADAESLAAIDRLDRPARLLAAARLGATRLIDNIAVEPPVRS